MRTKREQEKEREQEEWIGLSNKKEKKERERLNKYGKNSYITYTHLHYPFYRSNINSKNSDNVLLFNRR